MVTIIDNCVISIVDRLEGLAKLANATMFMVQGEHNIRIIVPRQQEPKCWFFKLFESEPFLPQCDNIGYVVYSVEQQKPVAFKLYVTSENYYNELLQVAEAIEKSFETEVTVCKSWVKVI